MIFDFVVVPIVTHETWGESVANLVVSPIGLHVRRFWMLSDMVLDDDGQVSLMGVSSECFGN